VAQGISIHCFDIARGVVAEGLLVEVYALAPQRSIICKGRAGVDALVAHPALAERFELGAYEIAFHVADYFRAAGVVLPAPPFLDVAGYCFAIDRADMHYHFPFKVTPWGYSLFVTTSG
jgi:5-hydroxyisourate hydrolase